jgi:hypothetical protein
LGTDAAVSGGVATGAGLALEVGTDPVPPADDEPGVAEAAGAGKGSGVALGEGSGVALGVAVAVAVATGDGPCAAATPPRIPA